MFEEGTESPNRIRSRYWALGEKMEYIQNEAFERRDYQRISLETQVIIKPVDNDSIIFGWIEDISNGGFKVRIDIALKFNDVFHKGDMVIFMTDEGFFGLKGRGEISWISTKGNEAGIKFSVLGNYGGESLKDFLKMCL